MPLSDDERKEKKREYHAEYYKKNREQQLERVRKSKKKNPEPNREAARRFAKANPELVKSYKTKYYEKNPPAQTEKMSKYRRSHRECEWSDCKQIKSLHVHHILSKHKYPEYVDGNYHGLIGNNFICYCPFHHFAYHYAYSTNRNDKGHQKFLPLIWLAVEQWASDNKISIEDLEIELAQMYIQK